MRRARLMAALLAMALSGCGAGTRLSDDDDIAGDDDDDADADADAGDVPDAGEQLDAGCVPSPWPELPGWSEEGVDYRACPDPDSFFGDDCPDESCADSPESAELVRAFRQAVEEQGIADRVEIVSASYESLAGGAEAYQLSYVVVVDWWRCAAAIGADGFGVTPATILEEQLPVSLPDSVPNWSEVLAELRTCDAATQPAPCRQLGPRCNRFEGTAGDCGTAIVRWSNASGGSGIECDARYAEECCMGGD